jgi:hypothetical protein
MTKNRANNFIVTVLLFSCSLLFVCAGCRDSVGPAGQKADFQIDKAYERGPLTVHVRLDREKITIAETILLQLQATIEPDYEIRMPEVAKVLAESGNFGILDWHHPGDRLDENNNVVTTYQYRLEPFLSGTYTIPAFTFNFHDVNSPEDKNYQLTTEPIDVEVTSLLGEQRAELKIADIEDVVEMPRQLSYRWLWIFVPAAVIAAAGTWLYLRRKRQVRLARIYKLAHEIAYERLRALVGDDLVKAGRIKEFYERISDILRHYIEHRFELRAPERTTEEFLIELQYTDVLSESDKDTLGEFLQHCDLVKFARYSPTTEQIQRTFTLVRDFIDKTKSEERKVDVTDKIHEKQAVEVGSA